MASFFLYFDPRFIRCRRPRLSSVEIEHKMANRRMIRLSQLPDRLTRENLEDSDWVTFAVLINKITPQSKNNVSSNLFDQLQHYMYMKINTCV